jgi:hypothetical protein
MSSQGPPTLTDCVWPLRPDAQLPLAVEPTPQRGRVSYKQGVRRWQVGFAPGIRVPLHHLLGILLGALELQQLL